MMHASSSGVSRALADDDKQFTTALYGNGPGHVIVNGTRPYINATITGMFCGTILIFITPYKYGWPIQNLS